MLTPSQFSQLAAAAWAGPAAIVQASAATCQLVGAAPIFYYSVCYTTSGLGGAQFSSSAACSCPFRAVVEAVEAFCKRWGGGPVLEHAQRVVAQAERDFAGAPAGSAVVCAVCGEDADYFGECGCAYVQYASAA